MSKITRFHDTKSFSIIVHTRETRPVKFLFEKKEF